MVLELCIALVGGFALALYLAFEDRPYYIDRDREPPEITDLWRWRE